MEDGTGISSYLPDLPHDLFGLISGRVCHRDLCNLSATCSKLRSACSSDKLWLPQCERLVGDESLDLNAWRNGMQSFKALFRFLAGVRPLVGIWVHQNPELGNLVYVTWGFLSVVGCRIIPQELGPRGMERGLLWAPVFEVLGAPDGTLAFFLHGRDKDDWCYPGRVEPAREGCNVLLLEAESYLEPTIDECRSPSSSPDSTLIGLSAADNSSDNEVDTSSRKSRRKPVSQVVADFKSLKNSFGRLSFSDRRRLLELLVQEIRIKMPALAQGPLFPKKNSPSRKEFKILTERHALLLWMHAHGDPLSESSTDYHRIVDSESLSEKLESAFSREIGPSSSSIAVAAAAAAAGAAGTRKTSFASFLKSKLKRIVRSNLDAKKRTSIAAVAASEGRKLALHDYLKRSVAVGLRLEATTLKLTHYRAWPIICENRFALYKLPQQKAVAGRELAGLWGGTFGWPPGPQAEDNKPGKPLFFLLLSYDEGDESGSRLLIATKILEGTHYVLHPNGSAMFTAKVDEAASIERFPWERYEDGSSVETLECYQGEGIATGYGFRYPSSKPGDLFLLASGLLAFVWRESKAVLALQRLDMEAMLRNGERVGALTPIANFAYHTKASSNVFAGYGRA